MAKNLFVLSKYFEGTDFDKISHQMLKNVSSEIEQYPSGFSNWMYLLSNFQNNFYEVVIVGNNASEQIKELNTQYLPNIIIAGSKGKNKGPLFENRYVENETLIYVCVNNTCKLPVTELKIAVESIKKKE
jgi:hypothetical protein